MSWQKKFNEEITLINNVVATKSKKKFFRPRNWRCIEDLCFEWWSEHEVALTRTRNYGDRGEYLRREKCKHLKLQKCSTIGRIKISRMIGDYDSNRECNHN